ncbi:HEAT repeat domain-containing protein, partial [Amycolatopsis lurida]
LDLADPEVREEYLHVLGVLDVPLRSAWEKGLGDPSEAVRVAALSAARLLSTPLPSGLFEPLLADPAETARIETIFTLGHAGGFDRDAVERSLTDPSAEVRRLAAELLAGTDRE